MVQGAEQVGGLDSAIAAMVKAPAHQPTSIASGFLLDGAIHNEQSIVTFQRSNGAFDALPKVLGCVLPG